MGSQRVRHDGVTLTSLKTQQGQVEKATFKLTTEEWMRSDSTEGWGEVVGKTIQGEWKARSRAPRWGKRASLRNWKKFGVSEPLSWRMGKRRGKWRDEIGERVKLWRAFQASYEVQDFSREHEAAAWAEQGQDYICTVEIHSVIQKMDHEKKPKVEKPMGRLLP